jgi:hypothetical protein
VAALRNMSGLGWRLALIASGPCSKAYRMHVLAAVSAFMAARIVNSLEFSAASHRRLQAD